jgi:hypothetical protein
MITVLLFNLNIDAHSVGEGEGWDETATPLPHPGRFSEKLVNKNAIKTKIGDHPDKNLSYPSPRFSTCVPL